MRGYQHVCACCEQGVDRIHWMDFGGDLAWLCSSCADQAVAEYDASGIDAAEPAKRDSGPAVRQEPAPKRTPNTPP